MDKKRERRLRRENWLERNHQWWQVFKGNIAAGGILLLLYMIYDTAWRLL